MIFHIFQDFWSFGPFFHYRLLAATLDNQSQKNTVDNRRV